VLPSGGSKGIHGSKEGGKLGRVLKQHLDIISIGAGSGGKGSAREEVGKTNATGTQEGGEGLGDEEVQQGSEGAPLPHSSSKGRRGRNEAIDEGTGRSGSEDGPHK